MALSQEGWRSAVMPETPVEEAGPLPKKLFGFDVISRLGVGAASQIYAVSDGG